MATSEQITTKIGGASAPPITIQIPNPHHFFAYESNEAATLSASYPSPDIT